MTLRNNVVLLMLCSMTMVGCQTFQEPPTAADATPPAGYAPIFARSIAPLPTQKPKNLALQASRVDVTNATKVRVYFNVVDSAGTLYYGGTQAAFKNMWCKVVDSVRGEKNDVKKFTLREVTENDREPVAMALVMDNSGSMGETRARAAQDGAEMVIGKKTDIDALSIVRYDHNTLLEVPLSTSSSQLRAGLKKDGLTGFGGGTAIHSGIATGLEHLVAAAPVTSFKRRAVIVFTDGQENSSKISRDSVVNLALQQGIPVCGVDFGDGVNEGYMQDIAKKTGGSYNHIYRTAEFEPVFEDVVRRLKNYYVMEFSTEDFGVHAVKINMCWPKDTVSTTVSFDNTPDVGMIALLNVFFDIDKSALKTESKRAIDNVVTLMRVYPTMTIEVRGHTDSRNRTNDATHNTTLSQKRAEAVREALVKAGVDATRISYKGFGDAMPVATNETEEGRAQNRRTEFLILKR
ncbi:MAG: OmpA family protein [bacterium]|nr:OmpA family protein [bacterium]